MSQGSCGSCKFWELQESLRPTAQWAECHLAMASNGKPEHEKTLAYASDAEGWAAMLATHRTFGCVQYQVKEVHTNSAEGDGS